LSSNVFDWEGRPARSDAAAGSLSDRRREPVLGRKACQERRRRREPVLGCC
jgi:hypothetical protein